MFEDKKIKMATGAVLILLAVFLLAKTVGEFKAIRFIGTSPQNQSSITVSGEGEEFAIPDNAVFSFSVEVQDSSVSKAQTESAKRINDIIAFLKKNNIEEKNIKTTNYNAYPVYEYLSASGARISPPTGKRTLTGFQVSQTIEVKTDDIGKAGELLSGIGEHGATNISGLSFKVSDEDALIVKAREKAIKDAQEKAEKLAKELNVSLVRIIGFNEGGGGYPYMAKAYYESDSMMGVGGGGVAPNVPTGENKITKIVNITYEIQ